MTDAAGDPGAIVGGGDVERIEATLARIGQATPAQRHGGDFGTERGLLAYVLDGGGKRIRPLLCVAAWRAASDRAAADVPAGVLDVACAVELIHGYSLVHDDLPSMDDAAVRRGRPAAHVAFGMRGALLEGAAVIPLAGATLDRGARSLGLSDEERAGLAGELAVGAGAAGMIGGQWLDLAVEGGSPTLAELEEINRLKTGALLVAAARIGARAARAGEAVVAALTAYAGALGLAFQIADDLLDVTGRPAVTGKRSGQDRERGKSTFVSVLGPDHAMELGLREAERAIAVLARAGVDAPGLVSLARFAIERDR